MIGEDWGADIGPMDNREGAMEGVMGGDGKADEETWRASRWAMLIGRLMGGG